MFLMVGRVIVVGDEGVRALCGELLLQGRSQSLPFVSYPLSRIRYYVHAGEDGVNR